MMFTLLLLSLLHITTCTVYTVTPDYDPNTTCHHCHNLQHYLLKPTKYFTSNTQLLFLPGIHHLHSDLIIQNVHNISLTGNTNGTTQDVVIQCNISGGVLMVNVTGLVISNMIIQDCIVHQKGTTGNNALVIKDCKFVAVYQVVVLVSVNDMEFYYTYAILVVNVLGESYFDHVRCDGIGLFYFEVEHVEREVNTVSIDYYQNTNGCRSLEFEALQDYSYKIVIRVSNINNKATLPECYYVFHGEDFEVIIADSKFNYKSISTCILVTVSLFYFHSSRNGIVHFDNCHFITNLENTLLDKFIITIEHKISLNITNCDFSIINNGIVYSVNDDTIMLTTVIIQNSTITVLSNTSAGKHGVNSLIEVSCTRFLLTGTVIFYNINVWYSIIVLTDNSDLVIDGKLYFINNIALSIIDFQHNSHEYIMISETSVVDINKNYLCTPFAITSSVRTNPYPYCFFQYISSKNLDDNVERGNISIKFYYNHYNDSLCMANILQNIPTTNCQWL